MKTNYRIHRSVSLTELPPQRKQVPTTPTTATRPRPALWLALWSALFCLLAGAFGPPPAQAGSGKVNSDGTIDITISFRFPVTEAALVNARNQVNQASRVLWDASEGQLRLGRVTFTTGPATEDLADIWFFAHRGRATGSIRGDGSSLGLRGAHITMYLPDSTGEVIAHELGHLALGLFDEYEEPRRFGACWGFGPCMEPAALSERNHCLMQQPPGFSHTEFCTTAGHDAVRGDNLSCALMPVPHGCADNCHFFNHTTGRYETTQQHAGNSGRSCWAHLLVNFPFLRAPVGLPVAAPPAGFIFPTIIDKWEASERVMLVLDRSDSMSWNTERNNGEVCDNGIDDDLDGLTDEMADCTQPRIAFVQAAARAWLALANNSGVKAGIISFDDVVQAEHEIAVVNDASLPGFHAAVAGLTPRGGTAIGDALLASIAPLNADAGANKAVLLISDGESNAGFNPSLAALVCRGSGIRVFTVATGGASSSKTLTDISGTTVGASMDSPSGTRLVNFFALQWARYRNITAPVRLQPFGTHGELSNTVFQVSENTPAIKLIFAGNMADMSSFGIRAILTGPGGVSFDTEAPPPQMRVVRDSFFTLVELQDMPAGSWSLQILAAPGTAPIQTGNLTILDENPDLDLFTSLDRHVVEDTSVPVQLDVTPLYHTELRNLDALTAEVLRPDGVWVPVPMDSDYERGGGGNYSAHITDMPFSGMYQVRVTLRTGALTFNDPGESIFAPAPANPAAVPLVQRIADEYFFVPHELVKNDRAEIATPLDLGRGCASLRGSINPSGDVDYYSLTVTQAVKVWVNIDTGGAMNPGATSRDSVVTLLAFDGVSVIEEDDDHGSGNGCDSTLESSAASVLGGVILPPGAYFIKVRSYAPSEVIDPYILTVALTDPDPNSEVEPNNVCGLADPIALPMGRRTGAIDYLGDEDFFSIAVGAGQVLTIIADGDPERDGVGTDVIVELIDRDCQTVLFSADSSGVGSPGDPAAEGFCYAVGDQAGTYFVRVRYYQRQGTGTYDLMVATKSAGTLQFSSPTYSVNENGGRATITVRREGGSAGAVTAAFVAFGGNATALVDYLSASGTITFNEGETSRTFSVPIINDSVPEGNETVGLLLLRPTGGALLGTPSFATLTLVETEPKPKLSLRRDGGMMIVSWPVWAVGYQLEMTMNPADAASWQPVQEQAVVVGFENQIILSGPIWTMDFFRLKKQ